MARRKDHFGRSLAISLVIHMVLLSLQFGAPGLGLPWPELAIEERKAPVPMLRTTLRPPSSVPAPVTSVSPAKPPVVAVEPPLPPRKKSRSRAEHVVQKGKAPTGKAVVARRMAKVPAAPPTEAIVVPQASSVMNARVEQASPRGPVEATDLEIVKPVVIVEKRKPELDGPAVMSTERESDWRVHASNPVVAGTAADHKIDIAPAPVASDAIREAEALERQKAEVLAEERRREEVALAAKLAEEQARARKVAEAVQERELAEREERAEAHARAAAEARRKEAEAVERLRAAREKARQERQALAREREDELKAEQVEWTAALVRAEEARKKEEQAAQLKAREEAAREEREAREALEKKRQETLAAEAKKREAEAARIAEAAQAKAREEAREEARIRAAQAESEVRLREQIAAANAAASAAAERIRMAERAVGKGGAGAADGSGKPAALAPSAKGADLARQALDMARSNLSGLPLKAPVETAERSRRGSILGRNPNDVQLAFYGESWVQKIERISSVNYPKLSRHLHYGSLVLSVTINSDGSLADRRIVKSSGNRELDEAVLRIVDMCAPFAAFPPDLKRNYDSVEVTRTLTFPEKPPVIVSQ